MARKNKRQQSRSAAPKPGASEPLAHAPKLPEPPRDEPPISLAPEPQPEPKLVPEPAAASYQASDAAQQAGAQLDLAPDPAADPSTEPEEIPAEPIAWAEILSSQSAAGWALVALVLLAFMPALKAAYISDDQTAIELNPLLRSAEGLGKIWLDPASQPSEKHYWPLFYTTFWIEDRVWGLNPFLSHIVNLALHALNSLLLWRLLKRLAAPGAWLAAAIFAVHPVHAESVVWAVERKDLLAGLFFFWGATKFLDWREASRPVDLALVVVAFVLGMLSKSVVITLPVALVLILLWRERRVALLPSLVLAALLALGVAGLVGDSFIGRGMPYASSDLSLLSRLALAPREVWFYIHKTVWPLSLGEVYQRWSPTSPTPANLLAPVGLLALVAAAWLARARWGWAPMLWLGFFLLALAPALGLLEHDFMRLSWVADRHLYLAMVAPAALIAAVWATMGTSQVPGAVIVNRAAGVGLILVLSILSARQSSYYESTESYYGHAVAVSPRSPAALYHYGTALGNLGRNDEAVDLLRKSVELDPDFEPSRRMFGAALLGREMLDEAEKEFDAAIRLEPKDPQARLDKAHALEAHGRTDDAVAAYLQAIDLNPKSAAAHHQLGALLAKSNRTGEGLDHLNTALALDPDNAAIHNTLGLVFSSTGRRQDAITHFQKAVALAPDAFEALNNLGSEYGDLAMQSGDDKLFDLAMQSFTQAIKANPNYAEAYNNLGILMARRERFSQALDLFKQAVDLKPDYAEAKINFKRARAALRAETFVGPPAPPPTPKPEDVPTTGTASRPAAATTPPG